jgi:hypothetical protein
VERSSEPLGKKAHTIIITRRRNCSYSDNAVKTSIKSRFSRRAIVLSKTIEIRIKRTETKEARTGLGISTNPTSTIKNPAKGNRTEVKKTMP